MSKTNTYKCSECGKVKSLPESEKAPECCEKEMLLDTLPPCTTASDPEMSRNDDDGVPCDDGRDYKD